MDSTFRMASTEEEPGSRRRTPISQLYTKPGARNTVRIRSCRFFSAQWITRQPAMMTTHHTAVTTTSIGLSTRLNSSACQSHRNTSEATSKMEAMIQLLFLMVSLHAFVLRNLGGCPSSL